MSVNTEFNEVHKSKDEGDFIALAFVKSTNIRAYPCGRRRAKKDEENIYIPFDPEARLNTEFNNRSHSSLNGYTQSYVQSWSNQGVALVLDNYLFNIEFATKNSKVEDAVATFGANIIKKIVSSKLDDNASKANKIYANILVEEVPLYSSNTSTVGLNDYNTEILRNQSLTEFPEATLDLIVDGHDKNLASSYYFSGLSFSTKPITGEENTTRSKIMLERGGSQLPQYKISLCILQKKNSSWQVYQPAYLPHIEHGEEPNSVKVDILEANNIKTNTLTANTLTANAVYNKDNLTLSAIKLKSIGGPSHERYYTMSISQATIEN